MRCETLLLRRRDSKVVHSVRVLEETMILRILLHVAPAATLPSARHQVELRCGIDSIKLMLIIVIFVNLHFGGVLTTSGGLIGALSRIVTLVLRKARSCIQVIVFAAKDVVSVGAKSIKSTGIGHFHLT